MLRNMERKRTLFRRMFKHCSLSRFRSTCRRSVSNHVPKHKVQPPPNTYLTQFGISIAKRQFVTTAATSFGISIAKRQFVTTAATPFGISIAKRQFVTTAATSFGISIAKRQFVTTAATPFGISIAKRQFVTTAAIRSSSTADGNDVQALTEFDLDCENETGILDPRHEDESTNHLLTNLYPGNSDPGLGRILEATTIEELFTTFESISIKGTWTPEQSSQALATLWDLQKFVFQIGCLFEPDRSLDSQRVFVQRLIQHSTFQNILNHILENVKLLEAEPIATSVFCLKKLDFSIQSTACQILLTELEKRNDKLPLPALSRVCVTLRNSSLYGSLYIAQLIPRLCQLIENMESGQDIRLVSIAVRSSSRCIPPSVTQIYYNKIATLNQEGKLQDLDPSIYCKVLLCLNDTKWIGHGKDSKVHKIIGSCAEVQRAVGHLLAPKVNVLPVVDVTSLQRILEFSAQEPPELIEAINLRVSRLLEEQDETPPLDLFSCLSQATRRSLEQRKRLASWTKEYLDKYPQFWEIYPDLLRVLRMLKLQGDTDSGMVYSKFWDRALQVLTLESDDPTKVIKLTYDYLSFNSGSSHPFRHIRFEAKGKQLLYFYIYNYINQQQPTLISPSDFAKAYGFLLAFSWHAEPIFQERSEGFWKTFEDKFRKAIRPLEILIMARGISASLNTQARHSRNSSRYFDQIQNFTESLEDAVEGFITGEKRDEVTTDDLIMLAKVQSTLRRASAESSTFKSTISLISDRASVRNFDSKEGRDLVLALSGTNYNDPAVSTFLLEYIKENGQSIGPDFAQRFLSYAFNIGLEAHSLSATVGFRATYDAVSRYWESLSTYGLLQSALMLSLVQCLQPPLAHNLFSTQFLNRLDEDVKSSSPNSNLPLKLRKLYMELNRTCVLDLPSANVPWFHQKYCESVFSTVQFQENPLDTEVLNSLREVLDDETTIQRNVLSPYFYHMNFLIEFDSSGKPVKKGKEKRLLSLQSLRNRQIESQKVSQSVGILILPEFAFSTNFRSLRGFYLLRKRHLEILGYKVIHIDPQHWNSMHMTQIEKAEFLENAIFAKSHTSIKSSPLGFDLIQ